jgi:hypothetical protein
MRPRSKPLMRADLGKIRQALWQLGGIATWEQLARLVEIDEHATTTIFSIFDGGGIGCGIGYMTVFDTEPDLVAFANEHGLKSVVVYLADGFERAAAQAAMRSGNNGANMADR